MKIISKEEFDRICSDYKGTYFKYRKDDHDEWVGRRTAMLPGEGATLSTEGIHFLVDGDYTHLPPLCKSNAYVGACYRFGKGYLTVKKLYRLTEEEAKKKGVLMLDRVTATICNGGKSHDSDFALAGSDLLSA